MQTDAYGPVATPVTFEVTADYGKFFLIGMANELERLKKEFAPWPVEMIVITEPGEYLTRCGETVIIENVNDHDCIGFNKDGVLANVDSIWARSGQLSYSKLPLSSNDIVSRKI